MSVKATPRPLAAMAGDTGTQLKYASWPEGDRASVHWYVVTLTMAAVPLMLSFCAIRGGTQSKNLVEIVPGGSDADRIAGLRVATAQSTRGGWHAVDSEGARKHGVQTTRGVGVTRTHGDIVGVERCKRYNGRGGRQQPSVSPRQRELALGNQTGIDTLPE